MKYVIVGGVTGGAGTAARLRRLDEKAEILIFEKGPYVSYSNCSIPYRLSETVDQTEKLILNTPQSFRNIYNIEVRVSSQVISIDRTAKKVRVKDLKNNREYDEAYDKLILSPGADPIIPFVRGIEDAKPLYYQKCGGHQSVLFFHQKGRCEKNLCDRRRIYWC